MHFLIRDTNHVTEAKREFGLVFDKYKYQK